MRSLDLQAARNGGVRVDGWDQSRYAVTVCKAAASADLLRELHVSVDGNKVTASGPDSRNWVIHYLVHAPRNATLNLESRNGPLSVHHVSGTITAHAKNGPITLKDVDGTIDATSVNGPIAYSGASGTVKLVANNGPLAVKLSGTHWEGTIDGRTENGPLALKVPRGFDSGVVLTSEGHGPIACRAAACGGRHVVRDEDDEDRPRQLSFGSGAKAITLTTVNGPLAVKEIDE